MRTGTSKASLGALRARLGELRQWHAALGRRAALGAFLRELLASWGAPSWSPHEDHAFRAWIERHGDERARTLLAVLDEELSALVAAGADARERASQGVSEPAPYANDGEASS